MAAMAGTMGFAQSTPPQDSAKADNTAVNARDRNASEPTDDQQKENTSDRETSRNIRQSIMADKWLSTDAQNIKIIAQNGTLTLNGPVASEDEKKALESKGSRSQAQRT
jgi:hyperosmotically inducible protein